jgi:hypothetical protein
MRANQRDQGCRLRKVVNHLEADTNFHAGHLIATVLHHSGFAGALIMSRVGVASQRQHENARMYRRRFRSGRATVLPGIQYSGNGYESDEYKVKQGLFGLTPPISERKR